MLTKLKVNQIKHIQSKIREIKDVRPQKQGAKPKLNDQQLEKLKNMVNNKQNYCIGLSNLRKLFFYGMQSS